MFRQVLRRGFCVSNNDPIHVRNAENDHYKKMFEKFRSSNSSEVTGNFQ